MIASLGAARRTRTAAALRAVVLAVALCGAAAPPAVAAPTWAEPQALSIVDMAGQVPDAVLRDAIVVGNRGMAQFVSSQRVGDRLRITLKVSTRRAWSGTQWVTEATLLGQAPAYDHPGSVAPASWLRLYRDSGLTQECTGEIRWVYYTEPTLALPEAGADAWERYPSLKRTLYANNDELPIEADGMRLPANRGGSVNLFGDDPWLWAVYTVRVAGSPAVTYLGEEAFTFQSYIGPGSVGVFQPLMEQLLARYGRRHPRFALHPPGGANYVLFIYPPAPFNVYSYDGTNLLRPTSGTVRLAPDDAMLSQDFDQAGAYPLGVAWQDADQSAGPYLSLLPPVDRVTPPEYVVPAGAAYNLCYQTGDCSAAVLDSLYAATMTLRVLYLRVEAPYGQLQRVPLRVADANWSLSVAAQPPMFQATVGVAAVPYAVRLPLVRNLRAPNEHPVGLFDGATGRMVGYLR